MIRSFDLGAVSMPEMRFCEFDAGPAPDIDLSGLEFDFDDPLIELPDNVTIEKGEIVAISPATGQPEPVGVITIGVGF